MSVAIRLAEHTDLPAIVAIYNAAIPGHQATADLAPVSVEDREPWFAAHDPARYPLWVATGPQAVLGWISLNRFYPRAAWDPTAEVSFYVHPDHQRQGIGRALLTHAIEAAPALGIRTVLAVVSGHNQPSLALLKGAGFHEWGLLPRVVHMPEARRDVVFLGLELDAG